MILECGCPSEFPAWDGKDVDLGGQCVLRLGIPTLLFMPLAYEAYIKRQYDQVQQLELTERWPGFVLTRTGVLRGEIIRLLESAESPSHRVSYLPSPFHVRATLHHGDIGTIRKSVRELQSALLDAGRRPKELYLSYLTCPRCEEQRGGAKILALRRWEDSPRLRNKPAAR